MPSLSFDKSNVVLVTGGTGYIGAWVVKDLLEQGVSVKLAVRTEAGADDLRSLFRSHEERITHVIVPDITLPGAFDKAVDEVDGIIHLASPVSFNAKDPQELIEPAIKGTVGILQSALTHGKRVKRVVITSSLVAAVSMVDYRASPDKAWNLSEVDWNESSVGRVNELGLASQPSDKYAASKILAEKAAWKFVETEKPSFDLVTVLPVVVIGPFIHQIASKDKLLNSSIGIFTKYLSPDSSPKQGVNYVDVRDAAKIHTLALSTEAAGGERIFASGGNHCVQDIWNIANKLSPPIPTIPKGEPGTTHTPSMQIDHSKALSIFPDFTFRPLESPVTDLVLQLQSNGWLN